MRVLARSYLQHGRRHAVGGSDPIPGLATGGDPTAFAYLSFNLFDSGHNQTVPAAAGSAELDVPWYTFYNSDPTVFGTSLTSGTTNHNTAGDKWVNLLQPGVYEVLGEVKWEAGSFSRYCFLTAFNDFIVGGVGLGMDVENWETSGTSLSSVYSAITRSQMKILVPSDYAPDAVKLVAGNLDASSAHQIVAGSIGVSYLGGDGFGTLAEMTVY